MAEIIPVPLIRCDNCGRTEEKTASAAIGHKPTYSKPRRWGSMKAEGAHNVDQYGGKDRLDFTDLCPKCVQAALDAAAGALMKARGEGFDGPTGAE